MNNHLFKARFLLPEPLGKVGKPNAIVWSKKISHCRDMLYVMLPIGGSHVTQAVTHDPNFDPQPLLSELTREFKKYSGNA